MSFVPSLKDHILPQRFISSMPAPGQQPDLGGEHPGLGPQLDLVGLDARDVEQIVDQPDEMLRLATPQGAEP